MAARGLTLRQRVARWLAGPRPAVDLRVYQGAEQSRLMADFNDPTLSADGANHDALRTLRNRGRQLVRDNALAQSFVRLATDNVVGPDGYQLEVTAADQRIADSVKAAFYRWAESPAAVSVDGRLSFADTERLVAANWLGGDGEALIRIWRGYGPDGLQLQVLDPDLLDEGHQRPRNGSQNEIRYGVEIDAMGKPVAYHLWSSHPTDLRAPRERVRVPASDIIHLYRPDRPGQTRGVTRFAPVMRDLFQLAGMQHATLVGQRVAAMQATWIRQVDELAGPLFPNPNDPSAKQTVVLNQQPAATNVLPFGYDVLSVSPSIPQNTYADFHRLSVHHIAVGLGVTYASLMADAGDANYSSMRTMSLRERRMWRSDQEVFRAAFHVRVFAAWLEQAVIAGTVRLRGAPTTSIAAEWMPTKWDWVDPTKDAQAAGLEAAMGLNSLTRLAADRGRDFKTILAERKAEIDLAAQLGVPLYLPTTVTADPSADPAADATSTPAADAGRVALAVVRAAQG